ncbi:MAG: transglutaminase-like domain-containing protein [Actinomycetota bacterium]
MTDRVARLTELLRSPEPSLDRVLAVVASVDPEQPPAEDEVVDHLDELSQGCSADDSAAGVLAHLFGPAGFAANRSDYYDPSNSLIHRVLERRRGIPLSLAAVAVEVGRRHGIELHPVGLPGHVLLGRAGGSGPWYDPFAGGVELDEDGCAGILAAIDPTVRFDRRMLAPMSPAAVAVRTLNNLRVAYASKGMADRLVPVLELRANLPTGTIPDRVELARLLAGLGRVEQAAGEFERLAELDGESADNHRSRARSLRARLN